MSMNQFTWLRRLDRRLGLRELWPDSRRVPAFFIALGAIMVGLTIALSGSLAGLLTFGWALALGLMWICLGTGQFLRRGNEAAGVLLRLVAALLLAPAVVVLTVANWYFGHGGAAALFSGLIFFLVAVGALLLGHWLARTP